MVSLRFLFVWPEVALGGGVYIGRNHSLFCHRSNRDEIFNFTPQLTMIMNLERAQDLNNMMNKFDRWHAMIRDNNILVKVRQAALFATNSEEVTKKMLAGKRDLDNYEKVAGQERQQQDTARTLSSRSSERYDCGPKRRGK